MDSGPARPVAPAMPAHPWSNFPMSADSHRPIPATVMDAAAAWLARRDRGLTPTEQDDYMHWLAADPRHHEALAQHAAALERMMQLHEWTPAHDTEPNPDLFAPVAEAAKARRFWQWTAGLATAAALMVVIVWQPWKGSGASVVAAATKSYLRVNERMALPDGSRVELKDGTELLVQYSAAERRVKLTGGEAHFSVWKDSLRPFVVDVAGVEVRAVGTAFNVRLGETSVEVLVTEGRVRVDNSPAGTVSPNRSALETVENDGPYRSRPGIFVSVRQRAVVPLAETGVTPAPPSIAPVTIEDIARELAWQAPRLQFHETPLADVVAEFNRLNRHQLELGEPGLGALRIGGTFRPDNVEGFIRLLDTTLGLRAEPAGKNRTVLRRGR